MPSVLYGMATHTYVHSHSYVYYLHTMYTRYSVKLAESEETKSSCFSNTRRLKQSRETKSHCEKQKLNVFYPNRFSVRTFSLTSKYKVNNLYTFLPVKKKLSRPEH